jgi:hypothetical protein
MMCNVSTSGGDLSPVSQILPKKGGTRETPKRKSLDVAIKLYMYTNREQRTTDWPVKQKVPRNRNNFPQVGNAITMYVYP